jgi:hypothetical protein
MAFCRRRATKQQLFILLPREFYVYNPATKTTRILDNQRFERRTQISEYLGESCFLEQRASQIIGYLRPAFIHGRGSWKMREAEYLRYGVALSI